MNLIKIILFYLFGFSLLVCITYPIVYLVLHPRPQKTPEEVKQERYIGCLENVQTVNAHLCDVWNK